MDPLTRFCPVTPYTMDVELRPDCPVADKACQAAMGKTFAAYVDQVPDALSEGRPKEDLRIREGKDAKGAWQTPGVAAPIPVEATVKETAGRATVNLMFKRIQTREESDGLRRAWGAQLDAIKQRLEA